MKLSPKIYCVGRRRIYPKPASDAGDIELEITLERESREQHIATLPLELAEARKLHRAIGSLIRKA